MPQGAVISPTVFNMVMTDLAVQLQEVKGLHLTIYADDVTL